MGWKQRDSLLLDWVDKGRVPSFLSKLVPIQVQVKDSLTNKTIRATFFVAPDYFSLGNDKDWARVPLSAKAAQQVLQKLNSVAPTPKLVDLIDQQASLRLEPVPLYAFRDSTPTMWHHHLIVEGQRKGRKGLISGIKKDIVFMRAPGDSVRQDRVGIYGWHRLTHKPIQPFYQGHVWWYADYSHGLRLVSRKVKVDHQWMDISALLNNPIYRQLLF